MTQQQKFERIVELMCSDPQSEELRTLLDTHELRAMASDAWDDLPARLAELDKYPHKKAFKQFKRRIRPAYRWMWHAAAAVVLVVGAGLLLLRETAVPDAPPILAASEHALFYSADGGVSQLDGRDTTFAGAAVRDGAIMFSTPVSTPSNTNLSDAPAHHRIVVPRGGIFCVKLSDGTRVTLNADSELTFPAAFAGGERRVALRGEGYFEVAHDAGHPFVVATVDGFDVRVLGTKFNVHSYSNEPQSEVTLLQGAVRVGDVVLSPNQQAVYDRGTGTVGRRRAQNAEGTVAWAQGLFYFDAAPLGQVLSTLERWYDVDFDTSGIDLHAQGLFSMRVNCTASLNEILGYLHDVTGLSARVNGRKIVVSGE